MNQKELEMLIATGSVDTVVIVGVDGEYEVWAHPAEEGHWPGRLGNRLNETARGGKPRAWRDLGRVFSYVRALGWSGPVTLEGGS